MLSSVPVEQSRIILAHELAHIRRHDGIINLIQLLIESVLFFNPAVWWLSRQIRVEREACCDALVAAEYARTLVRRADIGQCRCLASRKVALARRKRVSSRLGFRVASRHRGTSMPGELTDRVQRLVDPERASRPAVSWHRLGVLLLAFLLAAATLQRGTDSHTGHHPTDVAARARGPHRAVTRGDERRVLARRDSRSRHGARQRGVRQAIRTTTNSRSRSSFAPTDGSPLPKGLQLCSISATGNSTESKTLDGPREELAEYRREFTYPPCRLRFAALAQGFAVAASPTINLFEGDTERTVELVLIGAPRRRSRSSMSNKSRSPAGGDDHFPRVDWRQFHRARYRPHVPGGPRGRHPARAHRHSRVRSGSAPGRLPAGGPNRPADGAIRRWFGAWNRLGRHA